MNNKRAFAAFVIGAGLVAGACSSSTKTSSPTTTAGSSSSSSAASSPTTAGGSSTALTVSSFTPDFSAMSQLTSVTSAGKGLVGVILPDTTSSTRYVEFDAPYLTQAFQKAGYSSGQYKIDNAQGVEANELSLAQADITNGATVLVFDPLNSTVGAQVQQLAQSHGVKLISYDRATFAGTNTYYVSFDNTQVGKLIGSGFQKCVAAWNVASPKVFELSGGEDVDPNAISFANGYNSVIWNKESTPLPAGTTNSQGWSLVGEQITPNWTNATGATIFQQQYTAHPEINATVEANDGLANAVIGVLKSKGVGPKKIPTTGQDATQQGMQNILQGYQCGSVYKPVYLEAQDAVALATYLRAGQTPPSGLVNAQTTPPPKVSGNPQPASLLTPTWVTTDNMEATVIKDKFVSVQALCSAVGQSVCQQYGIS